MRKIIQLHLWRFLLTALVAGSLLPLTGSALVSAQSTAASQPLPASLAWQWPLAGRPLVAHGFDPPDKPWLSGHRGVDLLAPLGASIRAPTSGVVTFSGTVVNRPLITIATADGLRLSFESVTSKLKAGDAVVRGEELGKLAKPSHCDAGPAGQNSCLHWGVRRGDIYLNPLQFILDLRPSVLLPFTD